MILRKAAQLDDLSDIQMAAGSLTSDTAVDASDAAEVLRYAAKIITSFGK